MRLKTKRNIFTGLKTITAALLIILQVYPIFYVIISSMKTTDDFRSLPSYALPSALNFENYIKVFTTSPMLNYFKNSIIITVGVLIPLLLISFMAGFALSKIQFRGNKKILSYFLLGLMLPFQVALIPLFTILVRWESSTPIRQSFCHKLRSLCHTRFSCFIHSVNSCRMRLSRLQSLMGVHRCGHFSRLYFRCRRTRC